jgi:hypothetical protein
MKSLYLSLLIHHKIIFLVISCALFFASYVSISHAALVFDPVTKVFVEDNPTKEGSENINWLQGQILNFITTITIAIGGMVAGIGGVMLDLTVDTTILKMGAILNSSSTTLGAGIVGLWKVLRDIINIFFIFGLIYIGIKTILDSQKSETRRTLGMLIIAALIINFSLYITQVVIDFSNIAAVQVYNQIAEMPISKSFSNDKVNLNSHSIAGGFLKVADVGTLFDGGEIGKGLGFAAGMFYALFMMVFLVITGAVFFMGALLLIKRFIALILYMIFSPAMFIGWILPSFASEQEQWRKGFIQQAFVAPVFLFMLYLSLVVLTTLQSSIVKQGDAGFGGLTSGAQMEAGTFSIILFFALAIGFVFASIKIADKMSKAGASSMLSSLDTARSSIQGAMYRNTAGWGLSKAVNAIDAANRASEDPDASKLKKAGARGLRILTGGESGRTAMHKAANEGMGGRGRETAKHDEEARKQRAARGLQIHKIEHALEGNDPIAKEKAVRDASSAQLIEMIHHGQEELIIKNAGLLSDSQAKALMEDKGVDDELRNKLASARGSQIAEQLIKRNISTTGGGTTTPTMDGVISKADTSELKAIGYDELMRDDPTHGILATKLTAKQIDDWKDLTATEKSEIKKVRNAALESDFGGIDPATGGTNAAAFIANIKNVEERSKLPVSILTHEKLAPHLDINTLTKMVDHPGLGAAELKAIKESVIRNHKNHPEVQQYISDVAQYNSLTATQRRQTTAPVKTDSVEKYEKIQDWFTKNGAGMRY